MKHSTPPKKISSQTDQTFAKHCKTWPKHNSTVDAVQGCFKKRNPSLGWLDGKNKVPGLLTSEAVGGRFWEATSLHPSTSGLHSEKALESEHRMDYSPQWSTSTDLDLLPLIACVRWDLSQRFISWSTAGCPSQLLTIVNSRQLGASLEWQYPTDWQNVKLILTIWVDMKNVLSGSLKVVA